MRAEVGTGGIIFQPGSHISSLKWHVLACMIILLSQEVLLCLFAAGFLVLMEKLDLIPLMSTPPSD